jgi:ABC-type ATPase involved in cell division
MVLPHFRHDGGAIVLKRAEMDQLEAQHRNHLRRLIGVYYPDHIANQDLYERTGA